MVKKILLFNSRTVRWFIIIIVKNVKFSHQFSLDDGENQVKPKTNVLSSKTLIKN